MTLAEGIIGMIASVFAIIAGMWVFLRYLDKRFTQWTNAIVENSRAMRTLSARVFRLEQVLITPVKEEK